MQSTQKTTRSSKLQKDSYGLGLSRQFRVLCRSNDRQWIEGLPSQYNRRLHCRYLGAAGIGKVIKRRQNKASTTTSAHSMSAMNLVCRDSYEYFVAQSPNDRQPSQCDRTLNMLELLCKDKREVRQRCIACGVQLRRSCLLLTLLHFISPSHITFRKLPTLYCKFVRTFR